MPLYQLAEAQPPGETRQTSEMDENWTAFFSGREHLRGGCGCRGRERLEISTVTRRCGSDALRCRVLLFLFGVYDALLIESVMLSNGCE